MSAGAKAFLDLPRTLEHLESLGVPVLGWQTDEFPMFWCRTSGLPVPHRVDDAATVVRVVRAQRALTPTRGVLLAVPIPEADAIPRPEIDAAIEAAIAVGGPGDGTGAAVTPRILAAIGAVDRGPHGAREPRPGGAQRRDRGCGRHGIRSSARRSPRTVSRKPT